MKTPKELFAEHATRIQGAVSLKKTDRVPVVLFVDSFCARHQHVKMADFCNSPELACDTMVNSITSLGEIDGIEHVLIDPRLMSVAMLCDVLLPGRDLPVDSPWQVSENGKMTLDDFDTIINNGWELVAADILTNRLADKTVLQGFERAVQYIPAAIQKWADKGVVPFCPLVTNAPFDDLSMARGMAPFYKDLYKHGSKIDEVLKIRTALAKETVQNMIRQTHAPGVFIGCSRSASQFISRKFFERFAWPYMKDMIETIVAEGAYAYMHCDSNWDRDLDLFRDLPKGRCVMSSDSATNIYKMKELLDGHMCLMGDVPPSLLTLGTPDEVHAHCVKRIREIGPTGYILSQSCTIPTEAKPENVAAMIAAAKDA